MRFSGLTFSLRHRTHAVIFLEISGILRSPNDSRKFNAADRDIELFFISLRERHREEEEEVMKNLKIHGWDNCRSRTAPHHGLRAVAVD
jgi:hypothetical protein